MPANYRCFCVSMISFCRCSPCKRPTNRAGACIRCGGSGWGIGMMIMMALFWGAIIVAIILGMRWFVGQSKNSPGDSAMTIFRERFARGEIEKDEFET